MKPAGLLPRFAFAAAAILLVGASAGPSFAQVSPSDADASVRCSAFQRWGGGGWTATEPTMLHFDNGMALSVAPGESFAPGSTVNGMAVPVILDRHCGNL